jgi:hypothetical protein
MNIISRKLIATAVALGLVSIAGAVLAGTVTNNAPGSSCVYAGGGGTLNVRTDGEIENTSTTAFAIAICPVDRPIGSGVTTTQLSGTVFAVDRSSSADVCCWVASKNPDGGSVSGTSTCTSGSSSTYQQISLPGLTDNTTYSHFYVICSLPPAVGTSTSRLQTIRSIQQ